MKIDAGMLVKLMREVVRDELKKALPSMIEKHLTEAYIKKMLSEKKKSSKLHELMQGEEQNELEEVPGPMVNTDEDIYGVSPIVKGKRDEKTYNEAAEKLARGNSMLKAIYEDVQPLAHGDMANPSIGASMQPEVPLAVFGDDFTDRMKKLAKTVAPAPKVIAEQSGDAYERKMKELEERRKALDVPVPRTR